MRNLHWCLVTLLLTLSTGCAIKAPQVVFSDGTPVPTAIYMERNFRTEMGVEAYVSRIIKEEVDDGDYKLVPADYLKLGTGEVQKLKKDTFAIGGKVRVMNPKENTYTLLVVYTVDYPKESWPYTVSRVLYVGNSKDETFSIKREMEEANPEVKLWVVIQDGESEKLIEEKLLFEFETAFIVNNT